MAGVPLALLIGILGVSLSLLELIARASLASVPIISHYAKQGAHIKMRDTLYGGGGEICDDNSTLQIVSDAQHVS